MHAQTRGFCDNLIKGYNQFGYVSDHDAAIFDANAEHITLFDALDINNYYEAGLACTKPNYPIDGHKAGLAWHSKQH